MTTAGIYIHIPFCNVKCMYCDFYSVADRNQDQPKFFEALIKEINRFDFSSITEQFDFRPPPMLYTSPSLGFLK